MWTAEQWEKNRKLLAEQRAKKTQKRASYFGLGRSRKAMIKDVFDGEGPPEPRATTQSPSAATATPEPEPTPVATDDPGQGESLALTPEVLEPGHRACDACMRGDMPHRAAGGKIRKGHSLGRPKGVLTSTRQAEEALRRAAPKAVSTLIKALDDPNPWVALTAARTICERVIPVAIEDDPDRGPALVFPAGAAIAILPQETRNEIIAIRRRADGGEG